MGTTQWTEQAQTTCPTAHGNLLLNKLNSIFNIVNLILAREKPETQRQLKSGKQVIAQAQSKQDLQELFKQSSRKKEAASKMEMWRLSLHQVKTAVCLQGSA